MPLTRDNCAYTPFYCEENIWHLGRDMADPKAAAMFIAAGEDGCLFHHQEKDPDGLFWDYHVVCLADGRVYDLDSLLPFPVSLADYLQQTFPRKVPIRWQPRFRIIPMPEYLRDFGSNRSHMVDPDGGFLEPPPPWPAIHPERGNCVPALADMSKPNPGSVLPRPRLEAMYGRN